MKINKPTSLMDCFDMYLDYCHAHFLSEQTIHGKDCYLKRFILWCFVNDIQTVEELTLPVAEAYLSFARRNYYGKSGKPIVVETLRNIMTQVKVFVEKLYIMEVLERNALDRLELPKKPRRLPKNILSKQEVLKVFNYTLLFGSIGMRDRVILEVFYAAAIRRKELVELQVSSLHLDVPGAEKIHIVQGKGGIDRMVPISPRAVAWLKYYLDIIRPQLNNFNTDNTLFISTRGTAFSLVRMSSLVSKYLHGSGVCNKGSCGTFRHTAATHMLEEGADLRYIQEFLGHADISTTQIYAKVSNKKLFEVYHNTHPSNNLPLDNEIASLLHPYINDKSNEPM
jgi:integrase/recombinase XerD